VNHTLLDGHRFDVRGTSILERVVTGIYRRRIFKNLQTTNSEIWGIKQVLFAFIASISLFLTEYKTCRKSSVLQDVLQHHSAGNASEDGAMWGDEVH